LFEFSPYGVDMHPLQPLATPMNIPARAAALRRKYIRGWWTWVLGWTCSIHSDISSIIVILYYIIFLKFCVSSKLPRPKATMHWSINYMHNTYQQRYRECEKNLNSTDWPVRKP